MKTYKETTAAVLVQAKAIKTARASKVRLGAFAAMAVCLVFSAVMVLNGQTVNNSEQTRQPRLVPVCAAAEYVQQKEIVEQVVTPLEFFVRVRDIRHVKTEEERTKVLEEEAEINKRIKASFTGTQGEKGWTLWGSENSVVSLLQNDFLYITVEDYNQVQDMSVVTTQSGCATVVPYPYEKYNDDGTVEKVDTGIHINWRLSDETIDRIDEDPEMDLSQICDTVQVAVTFKDGTRENVTLELTLDDAGQIYVTHKGTTANG